MSAIRNTSSRATRLTARPSAYHSSVTIFEPKQEDATESPRRSKRIKLEVKEEESLLDLEDIVESGSSTAGISRKRKTPSSPIKKESAKSPSPRKPKVIQQSLKTPHPAPEWWKETYDTIKAMRSRIVAPVDTMGCDQAQYKESDPKNQRWATLVSLMLSSQTKDEVTDAAVSNLREALGGSLTVDAVIEVDEGVISAAIAKVGFWRRKTGYIKQTAQRLKDDFESDVPKTVDELCSLPGVGPKMAFLALQVAWDLNHGIGVDVHVHRITNRLGWHKKPTKNPEETRLNLQSWLPKELHREINHMLVGFGQVICQPVGPRCDLCDLPAKNLCPSAQKVVKTKNRKAVVLASGSRDLPPKLEIELEDDVKFELAQPPVDAQANC
ncbi:DNA glycosylase [Crucibulum laeve]|uniref:Endonuclease III homolog n=1 Tax=Crucibulum laeve TaxID=68775 RepID=A0A5C3LK08_9AGAR|nr:DNA glycosylase [Crucibulum laeve]